MKPGPPQWPLGFLRWFCREDFVEEIEGDLTEIFYREYEDSPAKAKRQFAWNVIKHLRPGFIKTIRFNINLNTIAMIKNYFKTAWRNLVKNSTYSIINIGGLAVGMAVAMLIGLWVYDEISFNKSHQNYPTIAQVRRLYTDPNTHETFGVENMHYPTAALIKRDYSQYFKHVVMAWWLGDYTISTAEKKVLRQGELLNRKDWICFHRR